MLLGVFFPLTVSAQDMNDILIASRNINENTEVYAKNILPIHLRALIESNELHGIVSSYNLGTGFSVFNVTSNTESVCFPVLQNGTL
jgi:hypothetical protein